MRRFLLSFILPVACALPQPALAQVSEDPCKNHYILHGGCGSCPSDLSSSAPVVRLKQGDKTFTLGSEARNVSGGPSPRGLRSLAIMKTDDAGLPDPAWGDCGLVRIPIWGADDKARAIAVQPDGKVLLLGTALDPTEYLIQDYMLEPHSYLALTRLNADGSLDPTFATAGRLVFRVGELIYSVEYSINSVASGIVVQPDGKIRIIYIEGKVPVALVRSDGTIEWTYASAPMQGDAAIEFSAAIEFVNEKGELFLAGNPDEAVRLDMSGVWYGQGAPSPPRVSPGSPGRSPLPE
jgi:hypothetical protein